MSVDPKIEAYARLRGETMKKATTMVILLGYGAHEFLDELLDCNDAEVLRDVLVLLPLQICETENMKEKNRLAGNLVRSRLAKLETEAP